MKLISKKIKGKYLCIRILFFRIKINLEKVKFYQKSIIQREVCNAVDNVYRYDSILSKEQPKLLLIGRDRLGDSIGIHTISFLNSIDYSKADVYLYDEYSRNLYHCQNAETKTLISSIDITEYDASKFDMLLFLGVINQGKDSIESKIPYRFPLISYCYSVFDGTIPPKGWVESINKYFDGLLVPVQSLVDIFSKNGCERPVFALSVAQDYSHFLSFDKKLNQKYRFGWVGYLEARKNPIKILQAFIDAFGNNNDVELVMHTRGYDKNGEYAKKFLDLILKAPKNVKFSCSLLSKEENEQLLNSFDCCVCPSVGEGFSNVPRESLASGSCVILSGIPTHKSITDKGQQDGIFWLTADKEVPALQPSLNNQICGVMFDCHQEQISEFMKKAYKNKDKLFKADKIRIRKQIGRLYDKETVKKYYNSLLFPDKIQLSDNNLICKDKLLTTSESLIVKYKYFNQKKKRKIIVSQCNDAGFFSMFNQYVSQLAYADENTFVIPDWRVLRLKMNVLDINKRNYFESFCYGNERDGNIFLKFFQPPYGKEDISDELYQTDLMYTVADKVLDIFDYNHQNEPNLTYINSYNLYKDEEYFPKFRKKYKETLDKYIRLQPHIQKRIDEFYDNNMKGHFCICAHIRCKAHATELLEDAPTFEKYNSHVIKILDANNISITSKEWRLFIASDNEDSINYFSKLYPHNVVYQKNIARLSSEDEKEYEQKKKEIGKDFSGLELQHRCAKDDGKRNTKMGEEILTDALLLSKGKYFIFVNSNISTAVSYMNPEINMVYCK